MSGPSARCAFVTFNVFADLPAFRHLDRRLQIVARAIAAERPDILALQELVRAQRCGDMGRILCDLVNGFCGKEEYQLHYAEADGLGEGEWKFDEGIALMGRLQLVSPAVGILKFSAQIRIATEVGKQQYRLPDDRVAIHARYVLAPGLELDAYGTHLTDRNEQTRRSHRASRAGAGTDRVGAAHQPTGKSGTDWRRLQRHCAVGDYPDPDPQRLH